MKTLRIPIPALVFLALVGFVVNFAPAPAEAQTVDDLSSLREFIERNAELLEGARELVSESNSDRARTALAFAKRLHDESINQLQSQNFAISLQVARRAREMIMQAIALAKKDAKLAENASRAIERASERFDAARQLVAESGDASSGPERKLLEESHHQLTRARDNYREHLYEISLRLALSSADLSQRIIDRIKQNPLDDRTVLNEIERTDHVLERLHENIKRDTKEAVRRLADEASDLQEKAKHNYHDRRYRVAVELTLKSRGLAGHALRSLPFGVDKDNVEGAIELTEALIGEAEEMARERRSERFADRIEESRKKQARANSHYARGQYDQALKETLRARDILQEALGKFREGLNKERVRDTLSDTDALLAKLEEENSSTDDILAAEMKRRAQLQQEHAWREFEDDELRSALAYTKLARNMARRALRRLSNEDI